MRRATRSRRILLVIAAALAAALVACAGGGTVETSRESEPRQPASANDRPKPTGDFGVYCEMATDVRGSFESLDEDPETSLDSLAELAELAPEELRGDFDVAIERLGQLEGLDEDDPSSFSKVLEIFFDPELLDALGAIDAFTLDACGFTLDPEAADDDSESGLDDSDLDEELFGDDETSISLEDVDEVKDDNEDASWSDKVSGTLIGGGSDVQLSADFETLSDAEALELCEVMLAGLSTKNPDVSVTVLGDNEPIASSSSDGTCSLR